MDQLIFRHINQILARDSKSSTYKFALLRGTIDLIEDNSPYIKVQEDKVVMPLGLLIEKWLLYYYSLINVPQINKSTQLAFAVPLRSIVEYYELRGGFSAFYNDLKNRGIPGEISDLFLFLIKKIANTITQMPMKYIGNSIHNKFYSIYQYEIGGRKHHGMIDSAYLINSYGTFSIPRSYFEAFQVLGSFINGQDAILFKWAEFSVQASGQTLSVTQVLDEVLKSPVTEREIAESKALYRQILQQEGKVYCVWSGHLINKYDIDHIIPFTIWKNNDLWNLLPSKPELNNLKRDKIPTPELIENRRELITHYWDIIHAHKAQRFEKELKVSLLGYQPMDAWQESCITRLKESCAHLMNVRGFDRWL